MSEALQQLHTDLAEQLSNRIKSGEATAAELSVAAKFLKDNGIVVDDPEVPGSPIGGLGNDLGSIPFPSQAS